MKLLALILPLLTGCSFSGAGLTYDNADVRKIVIEPAHVEISGDINSRLDYPEVHKLIDKMREK